MNERNTNKRNEGTNINLISGSLAVDDATVRTVSRHCHSYGCLHYHIQRF
ncbi:hypothetical protein WN51_11332 [Melipona quadrifasciata]|uniref:Uncharacterized protein n=1 Tax=Melipona quadrifasciata TaxID=166423 RepID=A0A0N0BJZ1_9HYME|nr:hypothetical protein WN51_11332 [Melipona quadrifasciata]